jgi:hypothetical protein
MTDVKTSDVPADLRDGWPVGDPEEAGFDPVVLANMKQRIADGKLDNVHAVLIARGGVLVYEQYSAGKDQNGLEAPAHVAVDAATRHNGNSITKSVHLAPDRHIAGAEMDLRPRCAGLLVFSGI